MRQWVVKKLSSSLKAKSGKAYKPDLGVSYAACLLKIVKWRGRKPLPKKVK